MGWMRSKNVIRRRPTFDVKRAHLVKKMGRKIPFPSNDVLRVILVQRIHSKSVFTPH
jgi:hypothetical protein